MVVDSTSPNVPPLPFGLKRYRQALSRVRLACVLLVCLVSGLACALDFPPLTGRVVDQAGVIPVSARETLETKLKDLEDKSGIQLVVATVKSLQGGDIETYANELFRAWKLGEAKKNNGVLLLVAPAERKVRIEVGYGLEGTLTDALSQVIIASAMVPRFKANDYPGGIERGVDGIISVLTTDAEEWHAKTRVRSEDQQSLFDVLFPLLLFLVVVFIFRYMVRQCWRPIRHSRPKQWAHDLHSLRRADLGRQRLAGVADRRGADRQAAGSRAGAARRAAAAHRGVGDADHRE